MRNAATQEALRSNMRYRHGAVITKGGKILGQGHNHIRTGFSGPLSAHDAVVLPGQRADAQACVNCAQEDSMSGRPSAAHSYFSMHAEMHAITSLLRGARPHVARSSVQLRPSSDSDADLSDQLASLAIIPSRAAGAHSDCSRLSDAPTAASRVNAADVKTKCDRALVEGAKREQQRVAFTTQNEWCLKPRYQKRGKKEPAPHARAAYRCGARVWPVGW